MKNVAADAPYGDGPDGEELLRRFREEHDRKALEQLLVRSIEPLKSWIRTEMTRGTPAPITASDVVDEVVMRILRLHGRPSFASTKELRSYLWKTANAILIDHYRKAGHAPFSLSSSVSRAISKQLETSGGLSAVDQGELNHRLQLALNLLSPEEQRVLRLFFFEGMAAPEVAGFLGITTDASRMRRKRALERLGEILRSWRKWLEP